VLPPCGEKVNTAGGAGNDARAAAHRGLGGMATGGSQLRISTAAVGVANVLCPIGDTERLPAAIKDGSGKLDACDSWLVLVSGDEAWLNGGGGRVGGSKWRGRVPPVAAAAVLCHVEKEGSAERGRGVEAGNPVYGIIIKMKGLSHEIDFKNVDKNL
jgi:hypothetical protein